MKAAKIIVLWIVMVFAILFNVNITISGNEPSLEAVTWANAGSLLVGFTALALYSWLEWTDRRIVLSVEARPEKDGDKDAA